MVTVFDFKAWFEEKNHNDYNIKTIYKNKDGEYIYADVREADVILSESQFKLWDSYKGIKEYVANCHSNKLHWGVASYSPKEAKHILTLNYQFLQTLNLSKRKAEDLCEMFVDWIDRVSFLDREYMLLFLLGVNNTEESITRFFKDEGKWWIKALVANKQAKNDPYIRKKIRELIVGRIQGGCCGEIIVNGNFQTMVSDPYAQCQAMCGQKPEGLLGGGEFYSHYWNERGAKEIDCMRSPLNARCENLVVKLADNEEMRN